MMQSLIELDECHLYQLPPFRGVERFIATTPETRDICNNPFTVGTTYTSNLRRATAKTLSALKLAKRDLGEERNAVVQHVLRGALNFGVLGALADAFGWERHSGGFFSSQRAYGGKDGWHITEANYQKPILVSDADWFIADVVATGVSLEHVLLRLIHKSQKKGKPVRRITFFTIGSARAEQLIALADARCRKAFPDHYLGARVIYFEGIFGVKNEGDEHPALRIVQLGTDLLRWPALLAPEFLKSQSDDPSYAILNCVIGDAGSRAYDRRAYKDELAHYWSEVLVLASQGVTYKEYLRERFPVDPRLKQEIPGEWGDPVWLRELATKQIARAHSM
jgi:hypothetical protein